MVAVNVVISFRRPFVEDEAGTIASWVAGMVPASMHIIAASAPLGLVD